MKLLGVALPAVAMLLALTGCGRSDTASLMLDGSETALTLERIKPYAWSETWDLELIVRRNPDCQRRHKLKKVSVAAPLTVEIFTPESGVFIVRQDKRWYVTDLKSCELQAFKAVPPHPGTPVGAFKVKGEKLGFVRAPQEEQPAPQPGAGM